MLATVLGCVCLGIASIIYLVVRFLFFNFLTSILFFSYINFCDLKDNSLNVVTVRWDRKQPSVGHRDICLVSCDMTLKLWKDRRGGSVWLVFLVSDLLYRQPSEVSTGSPFSQVRRFENLLQRASRILPRIHHQDLRQWHAGSVWKTWRQRPTTTQFLSLPMNKQLSSCSFGSAW